MEKEEIAEEKFRRRKYLLLKTIFLDLGLTGCDLITDLIQAGAQNIAEKSDRILPISDYSKNKIIC